MVVGSVEERMHERAALERICPLAAFKQELDIPWDTLDEKNIILVVNFPLAVKHRVRGADDDFGVGRLFRVAFARLDVAGKELVEGFPVAGGPHVLFHVVCRGFIECLDGGCVDGFLRVIECAECICIFDHPRREDGEWLACFLGQDLGLQER